MVTDHIGQAGVEFVHPTTDSVCPVKIEMDSCTRQASLPENSETRRVEFAERKVDFGRPNLNFSSAQTVVKSASTPVDGLVEKQDEDQVCSPLLVPNAAVSAAAGDLNTTDFSRYETRSRVSVSPDQVCMKSGSSNATHTFSTPLTMTHKLNPCIPVFVPQETRHFHKHNFDAASSAEINGAGRLTTHQHMPHKDFHSYMPVKHSYGHSSDAVVGHSGGHSGAGGYIAPDSQFGVVLDRLSDVLADSRNRLPEVVIPKFSGDPLDFASFVRSFDSRIASRTSDEGERLYYLEQFTVGTAREIVRSCMHMPLELAYQEARRRLERRFGDKFLLSQAYIRKLESWSAIRNDDVKRLDEFTTFLIGCSNAMTCSDAIRELDYPSSLRLVVSKLPSYLQERWTRLADKILYLEGDVVTFSRLVSFLEDETRIKLNPVFGKAVLGSLSHTKGPAKKSTSVSSSGKKSTSVAAVVKQETSVSGPNSGSPPCLFCSLQHPFERCRRFQKILHKAKISFLMQNKLCFDCLGKDHLKSQCSKKVACDVCKGPHNTLLHRPAGKTNVEGQVGVASGVASSTGKTSVEGQSGVTSGGALPQKVSVSESVNVTGNSAHVPVTNAGIKTTHCHDIMPIVPVKLKLTCNDTEIYTHVLLDSGSSDTLITEETMTRLGAGGKRVTINLTTVNGDSPSRCYAVSGLEVCGLKESSFVPLPVVYSQESLPVSRDQIPSQHDVDRWDYLSHIDIPSLDADIGILIGNNVPRAVEPWEVINSESDGPYAVRTLLGWCVNGPLRGVAAGLNDDKIPAVSVNRLQISCLEDQVQRYFDMDFSDHQIFSDEKALSVEDQQFFSLMEQQTTLHQGHYEICLPLRDSSVPFPNNRPLALQRMKSLEKKFRASDIFKRKYVSFVDDLFVKGHASEVSVDEVHRDDGFLWYLPHHGVIHPRKNKLRVVLDASARFAGVSLNDRLLPGPDLSSSLIGVLVCFRQERVAFMADLECMFYQVRVPVSQRDLLRFLWGPQGDVSKDMVECQMHTHIFGASSSPAVAKYALRKTASDNAENFSPEALMTVKRCFYVDDCLKSVSCVEECIVLAEEGFASWLRRVDSGWRSGSATVDMSWTPFQHQRERKTWRRWIWVVRNFHLKGPWVSCGQWSQTCLVFMWTSRKSLLHDEVFFPLFPRCTTPLEWQPQLLWMERWLFRICAVWSWAGMIVFQMMSAPDGSSGCKLCPVWMILWSRDVMFQRILECCFRWSFIISLMRVSLVTDAYLTCASQTSLGRCIVPSLLASHVLLHWSKWLSLGWSWLLQFSQLELMSNSGMNLTWLWATATFGQTVPLCWVMWKMKGPDLTSLLQTGWPWLEKIHHLLNGIMCHLVLTQQTTLPEVWMERPFFNVTGGRMGLGFCGIPRKSGQCNQIVMVLMTTILRSKWPYVLLVEGKRVTSFPEFCRSSQIGDVCWDLWHSWSGQWEISVVQAKMVLFNWMVSEILMCVSKILMMQSWLWFSGFSNWLFLMRLTS